MDSAQGLRPPRSEFGSTLGSLVSDKSHDQSYISSVSKLLLLKSISPGALLAPTRLQFANLAQQNDIQIQTDLNSTFQNLPEALLCCSLCFSEAVCFFVLKTVDFMFNLEIELSEVTAVVARINESLLTAIKHLQTGFPDIPPEYQKVSGPLTEAIKNNTSKVSAPNQLFLDAIKSKELEVFIQANIQEVYDGFNCLRMRASQVVFSLFGFADPTEYSSLISSLSVVAGFQDHIYSLLTQILTTKEAIKREEISSSSFKLGKGGAKKIHKRIDSCIWKAENLAENHSDGTHCGSKEQIIKKITEDSGNLYKVIIATYHTFMTPFEGILSRLITPVDEPPQTYAEMVRVRTGAVLKYWIKTQFSDFDEHMIVLLRSTCTNELPSEGKHGPEMAKNILALIESKIGIHVTSLGCNFIQLIIDNPQEIARQLTLISFGYFQKIGAKELLNCSWSNAKRQWTSPNVIRVIKRTDHIAFWVASVILSETRDIRRRARIITSLIFVAQHLQKLQDFNSLMGIVVGLNTSSILRLKVTWKEIAPEHQEVLNKLQNFMSPERSFASYRAGVLQGSPPMVPFIAVYLSDLTFIQDGNPDEIQDQINVGKKEMIYAVIEKLQLFQADSYSLVPLEPLHSYLSVLPCCPEDLQYELSLVTEAKGGGFDSSDPIHPLLKRGRTGSVKALVQRRASLSKPRKAKTQETQNIWGSI